MRKQRSKKYLHPVFLPEHFGESCHLLKWERLKEKPCGNGGLGRRDGDQELVFIMLSGDAYWALKQRN